MSRLTDLLRTASQLDPQLAKDLEEEIAPLQERLPFGLNFERHAPEAVELPGHKIRKMSKVRVLPPRGITQRGDQRIWTVDAIAGDTADLSTPNGSEIETASVLLDDLVLVAEFRDRIYPGLRPDGTVERGGNKPFHTVINGENFHVLEQLTFTHEKSVDVIYIDPPYNSGARDWKYSNDYVVSDDLYRHSKWLAFMERRLKIAKRLLKPENSVLIVSIDEKEYLRLGMLLDQLFPDAQIQMISTLINPKGVARGSEFYRVDEYLYFVRFGASEVQKTSDPMIRTGKQELDVNDDDKPKKVRWGNLLRSGTDARRVDRRWQFYPIFLDGKTGNLHSVGEALLPVTADRASVIPPDGTIAVWPIRKDGSEGRWTVGNDTLRQHFADGLASIGRFTGTDRVSFSYVTEKIQNEIHSGSIQIVGKDDSGTVILERAEGIDPTSNPKTMWNKSSHSASEYGSTLLRDILPGRKFPYPKSLYAVEDALRFFVGDKPDAVILDFFAGSGTTCHAVMRLNRQDGGRRQCISVTNNEVSADEQKELQVEGYRPGDIEWEQWGICDYITKPRIRSAITGTTPEGNPIQGNYKFVDESPMPEGFEENAAFFTLTYESKWLVGVNRAFAAIAPMLWLRAGAVGPRIDSIEGGWEITDSYGILKDLDDSAAFIEAIRASESIRIAYIVTDDEGRYQQVTDEIRDLETVRLYEDYLRNCEMTGDF